MAKIDSLKLYLETIREQDIVFDAITIQESWLDNTYTSSTANIQIEGYNCIPQGKQCGQKGGLITYTKTNYEIRKLDICPPSGIWEGLFVDAVCADTESRLIIGNIYKPPRNNNNNANIDQFITELSPVLESLDKISCDVCLAGDYNINLLKMTERSKFSDFFDKMLSHSLYPKITFPTRIGSSSCTMIDNIYCRLSSSTLNSEAGVIFSDLSDHFPCFVSLQLQGKRSKKAPTLVKQKINCATAISNLRDELINHDFSEVLQTDPYTDPNINYESLIGIITRAKNKHLPTKLVKFNKHKHKKVNG